MIINFRVRGRPSIGKAGTRLGSVEWLADHDIRTTDIPGMTLVSAI